MHGTPEARQQHYSEAVAGCGQQAIDAGFENRISVAYIFVKKNCSLRILVCITYVVLYSNP